MAFVGNEPALFPLWHHFFTNSHLWFSHNILPTEPSLNCKRVLVLRQSGLIMLFIAVSGEQFVRKLGWVLCLWAFGPGVSMAAQIRADAAQSGRAAGD